MLFENCVQSFLLLFCGGEGGIVPLLAPLAFVGVDSFSFLDPEDGGDSAGGG